MWWDLIKNWSGVAVATKKKRPLCSLVPIISFWLFNIGKTFNIWIVKTNKNLILLFFYLLVFWIKVFNVMQDSAQSKCDASSVCGTNLFHTPSAESTLTSGQLESEEASSWLVKGGHFDTHRLHQSTHPAAITVLLTHDLLAEILEYANTLNWRYVESANNPEDIPEEIRLSTWLFHTDETRVSLFLYLRYEINIP